MAKTHAPSLIRTIALLWRTLVEDVFDPYRPELHYMRGPGPKWRQKHGIAVAASNRELSGLAEATA
jgi:hypothetical protein